jgi:hypothetical protein
MVVGLGLGLGLRCVEALIALLVQLGPILGRERADHLAQVDQVKGRALCPFLEHVVNFQNTVGRQPV